MVQFNLFDLVHFELSDEYLVQMVNLHIVRRIRENERILARECESPIVDEGG